MGLEMKIWDGRKMYEMLEMIRRTPKAWLTSKSISALQNFLSGYMVLGFKDDVYLPGEPTIDSFKDWILNKYDKQFGAFSAILEECNGDEEKAFDRFFENLVEFKK